MNTIFTRGLFKGISGTGGWFLRSEYAATLVHEYSQLGPDQGRNRWVASESKPSQGALNFVKQCITKRRHF